MRLLVSGRQTVSTAFKREILERPGKALTRLDGHLAVEQNARTDESVPSRRGPERSDCLRGGSSMGDSRSGWAKRIGWCKRLASLGAGGVLLQTGGCTIDLNALLQDFVGQAVPILVNQFVAGLFGP